MTPFSRVLAATNWKYAVGEVLLIFVGVMLALGANSWYEDRVARQEERQILSQLKSALQVDKQTLESNLEIIRKSEQNVSFLLNHIDSTEPFTQELIPSFSSLRRWVSIRPMTAPYEALKSRGLSLISDSALQLHIVYYYENQFPLVETAYLNDQEFVRDEVLPFNSDNLHIEPQAGIVPLDYESLRSNQKFRNLCAIKLERLRERHFQYYEEALEKIQQLTQQITAHASQL